MMRSLKLRIALLTSLITGGIIFAGAFLMLRNIRETKLERLDEEIKVLSITNLPRIFDTRPPRDRDRDRPWQRPTPSTPPEPVTIELDPDLWITITRPDGSIVFASSNTPEAWLAKHPSQGERDENPFLERNADNRIPIARIMSSGGPGGPRGRDQIPIRLLENMTFSDAIVADERFRLGRIETPAGFSLVFGKSLQPIHDEMLEIRHSLRRGIPLFILLTALASAFLASRALSPFKKLSKKIDTVSAAGLHARLESEKLPSEFQPLVGSINSMLERIYRSFLQANRFTGDASHELRTPLTILQGHLEKLIQTEPEDDITRQAEYVNLLDEVSRLQRLSSQLLFLAKSDSGHFNVQREPTELNTHLEELIEDYSELYPEHAFTFHAATNITVDIDWQLVQQAVANLLNNAALYADTDKQIRLVLEHDSERATISVYNSGQAIPEDVAAKLFDRFYRGEQSRARSHGQSGTGLGLSLARECVKANGGTLEYVGLTEGLVHFRIELPI